jgi:hypothetical protein
MKTKRGSRGQFIIIAVLLTAIMIVSIGALMHSAVTYYKHEPWEEYATLIGDIEVNSARMVEISLASYTNGGNAAILGENLEKWQNDLTTMYPSSGIVLRPSPGTMTTGMNPTASADFSLDIRSIGLSGYKFSATSSLSLDIVSSDPTLKTITVVVKSESGQPIPNLITSNFKIGGTTPLAVRPSYDDYYVLVYTIQYQGTLPATLDVTDQRGILATGTAS